MAKIYFYHGTMGSSKSAQLLMIAHSYKENGSKPLVLKPSTDTRNVQFIESRIGLLGKCELFDDTTDILNLINQDTDVVIIDEVQFITENNAKQLREIAYKLNIPIIVFGLLLDTKGKLFDGAKLIIESGCKLKEIKHVSKNGRATHHIAIDKDGKRIEQDEVIKVGYGYKSVTAKEFYKY